MDDAERRLGVPHTPMTTPKPDGAYSEVDLLRMLRARYSRTAGNGPRYVLMEQVRSAAGFDAERTADVIVMHLWPSDELELHGFEIKVSRGDWLRELTQPEKSAPFREIVDRCWIVAPDTRTVKLQELPAGWGLIVVRGEGLRVRMGAELFHPGGGCPSARWLPRSFVAAMLRAAARPAETGPIS